MAMSKKNKDQPSYDTRRGEPKEKSHYPSKANPAQPSTELPNPERSKNLDQPNRHAVGCDNPGSELFREIPKSGQPLEYYSDCLSRISGTLRFFEKRTGWLNWWCGKVLVAAREECERRGKGEWGKFLKINQVSKSQAYLLRKLAVKIREETAREASYTKMLTLVYPQTFKKSEEDEPEKKQAVQLENSKEGHGGRENGADDVVDAGVQDQSSESGKAGGGTEPEPEQFTLSQAEERIGQIRQMLDELVTRGIAFSPKTPKQALHSFADCLDDLNCILDDLGPSLRQVVQKRIVVLKTGKGG